MSYFVVRIPDVPPSLNRVGGRGGYRVWQRRKKTWQRVVEQELMVGMLPRSLPTKMRVSATLRFPVRRRRDVGNYKAILDKAVGDALVNGGWIRDDTPEYYVFESLSFDRLRGSAQTTLEFRW